jgi:hypothetical protein
MTTLIQASGLAAWFLLCAEVTVGVMFSGGMARYPLSGRRKLSLHRSLSWALLAAIAAHITVIVAGRYHGWNWHDVLQVGQGSGGNNTVARNCAVVALWLLLIVMAVTTARQYVPRSWWRPIHRYGTLVVLVLATVHGAFAGPGVHRLETIIPGVVALTLMVSTFIVRWSIRRSRVARKVSA